VGVIAEVTVAAAAAAAADAASTSPPPPPPPPPPLAARCCRKKTASGDMSSVSGTRFRRNVLLEARDTSPAKLPPLS
jgi:hypothetical protein